VGARKRDDARGPSFLIDALHDASVLTGQPFRRKRRVRLGVQGERGVGEQ